MKTNEESNAQRRACEREMVPRGHKRLLAFGAPGRLFFLATGWETTRATRCEGQKSPAAAGGARGRRRRDDVSLARSWLFHASKKKLTEERKKTLPLRFPPPPPTTTTTKTGTPHPLPRRQRHVVLRRLGRVRRRVGPPEPLAGRRREERQQQQQQQLGSGGLDLDLCRRLGRAREEGDEAAANAAAAAAAALPRGLTSPFDRRR